MPRPPDLAEGAAPYVERGRDLVEEIVEEAAPLVGFALRRRRRRRRAAGIALLLGLALFATVAAVVWMKWRERRDEEPARLRPEPDRPNIAPAGPEGPGAQPAATPSVPVAVSADGRPSGETPAPEPVPTPISAPAGVTPRSRGGSAPPLPSGSPARPPAISSSLAELPPVLSSRPTLPY